MTVYVDDWRQEARVGTVSGKWSHLTADTEEELHNFAAQLGLKRSWFQHKEGQPWFDHYDITESKRQKAISLGAVPITWREAGKQTMRKLEEYKAAMDEGKGI